VAKTNREIMEILEAFDLTRSYRAAAQLTGTDHKTVAHYVERRDAGYDPYRRARRARLVDEYAGKIEEWVDASHGKIRADVAFDRLLAMGFSGDLEWVSRAENLAIWGPSGTGKTHVCEALGAAVIEKGMRVAWFTLESLTAAIGRAKVDASVQRVVARICRADFIVIDDIGMLPSGQEAAEAFYRVIDAAYEKRSVALTSHLPPCGFDTIMPKTLATAAVDRFLHHAHMVSTGGASIRLEEALAGKGVKPLV